MEINRILAQLYAERERVQRAIAMFELLLPSSSGPAPIPGRRGRKSMGAEEREAVAARMRTYWEARRQQDLGR
jgi:hypothetical protein